MTVRIGWSATAPDFHDAAKVSLGNTQLRHNVKEATDVIRAKRPKVVGEMPNRGPLRQAVGPFNAPTSTHPSHNPPHFNETIPPPSTPSPCSLDPAAALHL